MLGLPSSGDDSPVLCLFRRCTGGYCPLCGMTRALARALEGDVAGSWHQHPYLLLALAQATVIAGAWVCFEIGATPAPFDRAGPDPGRNPALELLRRRLGPLALANGVLLLVIWALRLATGTIPAPFS
jgi:hypothetical protein